MRNSYNNSVWVSDLLLSAPGGKQHLSWGQTQRDSGRQSVNGWHDQTWHGSRLMNFNHVMSSLSWLICHVCHVSQTAGNEHVEAPMSPGAGYTKHTQDTHQGDNRTSGPSEMKSSSRRHFSSHLNMRVTTERMWTMIDIFSLLKVYCLSSSIKESSAVSYNTNLLYCQCSCVISCLTVYFTKTGRH